MRLTHTILTCCPLRIAVCPHCWTALAVAFCQSCSCWQTAAVLAKAGAVLQVVVDQGVAAARDVYFWQHSADPMAGLMLALVG